MHRCLQLAALAAGNVAPNPMVGAVLVHEEKIIGEGYHRYYGQPHAEVNCIASVKDEDKQLIPKATLYVSLEPCAHWGKTPPCADLIIEKKIPKVVVGCRDPFAQVNGKGVEKLVAAGIDVTVGILEDACKELNRRFFTFHTRHRPYIVLKWAQTADGKIASLAKSRLHISNAFSARLVHRWRSEEAGIVIGTNTAQADDPQLDVRLWRGQNPVRIAVDLNLRLSSSLKIFDGRIPTIVFNLSKHSLIDQKIDRQIFSGVHYYQISADAGLVHQLTNGLYHVGIQSILVEGGAQLLQSFIDEGMWDEARVITNESLFIGEGLSAPQLSSSRLLKLQTIFSDTIRIHGNTSL